jgi:hypothetical protein
VAVIAAAQAAAAPTATRAAATRTVTSSFDVGLCVRASGLAKKKRTRRASSKSLAKGERQFV